MTTLDGLAPGDQQQRSGTYFGHPKGLTFLFLTEMWERFSYYGMKALLVLYMVKYLLLPGQVDRIAGFGAFRSVLEAVFGHLAVQPMASQIYGLYTSLVYLTPIFGGIIADRWLGQRRVVIFGALIMAAGHFLMAFELMFLVALFLLILGVGAFKPNTTSQVGSLYATGDPRRDRGYSVFYVGINLGAFLSPLVCGSLGETYGWHWGFGVAGIGMLLSTLVYAYGQRHLPPDQHSRAVATHTEHKKLDRSEWGRVGALVALCLLASFFWAVYEQQGNTIALWADTDMDRTLWGGWAFPTTWVQSINPFMIFAFTPFVTAFWARQAKTGSEPANVTKLALGCLMAGLSYLILALAAETAGAGKASWLWLIGYFTVLTTGELYLSPVGLSLVSKTAPIRIVSMMTGVWFLQNCLGGYLAGWLGAYWETMPHAAFFSLMTGIAVVAAGAIWMVGTPLKRIVAG